jgi:hypothetical protein
VFLNNNIILEVSDIKYQQDGWDGMVIDMVGGQIAPCTEVQGDINRKALLTLTLII